MTSSSTAHGHIHPLNIYDVSTRIRRGPKWMCQMSCLIWHTTQNTKWRKLPSVPLGRCVHWSVGIKKEIAPASTFHKHEKFLHKLKLRKEAFKPTLTWYTLCMTFLEKGAGLYFGRVSTFQQPGAGRDRVTGTQWLSLLWVCLTKTDSKS